VLIQVGRHVPLRMILKEIARQRTSGVLVPVTADKPGRLCHTERGEAVGTDVNLALDPNDIRVSAVESAERVQLGASPVV